MWSRYIFLLSRSVDKAVRYFGQSHIRWYAVLTCTVCINNIFVSKSRKRRLVFSYAKSVDKVVRYSASIHQICWKEFRQMLFTKIRSSATRGRRRTVFSCAKVLMKFRVTSAHVWFADSSSDADCVDQLTAISSPLPSSFAPSLYWFFA